jgi:hypothetical protein
MKQKLSITVVIAATITLMGCANMPKDNKLLKTQDELSAPLISQWKKQDPAVKYFKTNSALVIEEPNKIPAHIRNITIETELSPESTVGDIAILFDTLGIYAVAPEEEVRNKKVALFAFKGSLGDYLDAVSSTYDVSFNWRRGNILTIESSSNYSVKIPQDEDLASEIKTSLVAYGADSDSINVSVQAGTISYKATYEKHRRITDYINRLSANAALVSIQASVVTVALNRDQSAGFDWSSLQGTIGSMGVATTDSSTSSTETSAPNGNSLSDLTSIAGFSGTAASLGLLKGDFKFNAAVNFLSTYGNTETKQSVLMKTLSGKEVGISSTQQIPYVDDIGATSMVGSSNSGTSRSSTKVKTIDVGLELNMTPYYDASTEIVTIDLNLSLSSLLGFIELSAGKDAGVLSHPNTQKQKFDDIIKLRAGEPVIVGGITFDSLSDNRTNPTFMDSYDTASKNEKVNRNAMFILLRPTVTLFGNFDQDSRISVKE